MHSFTKLECIILMSFGHIKKSSNMLPYISTQTLQYLNNDISYINYISLFEYSFSLLNATIIFIKCHNTIFLSLISITHSDSSPVLYILILSSVQFNIVKSMLTCLKTFLKRWNFSTLNLYYAVAQTEMACSSGTTSDISLAKLS